VARQLSHQDSDREAIVREARQVGVVLEVSVHIGLSGRQRHPQLHAVQRPLRARWGVFRVRDAVPGRHQVELSRADQLLVAECVLMQHVARDQPADRLQTGVRVRGDAHPGTSGDVAGSVVIGETPRPDEAALLVGKDAGHDRAVARADDHFPARQQLFHM
jgi:hypothetical protein